MKLPMKGLTLVSCQMPTHLLSHFPCLSGWGKRFLDKIEKPTGWWGDHSLFTVLGKIDLTWQKLSFIYCQIKQVWEMWNKNKSQQPYPPPPLFFPGSPSLLPSQLVPLPPCQTVQCGWEMGACGQSVISLLLLPPHTFPLLRSGTSLQAEIFEANIVPVWM